MKMGMKDGPEDLCLVVYTAELLAHFLLKGFSILKDWMICMDLAIIVCHSAPAAISPPFHTKRR